LEETDIEVWIEGQEGRRSASVATKIEPGAFDGVAAKVNEVDNKDGKDNNGNGSPNETSVIKLGESGGEDGGKSEHGAKNGGEFEHKDEQTDKRGCEHNDRFGIKLRGDTSSRVDTKTLVGRGGQDRRDRDGNRICSIL
jgi:hypothetical protein